MEYQKYLGSDLFVKEQERSKKQSNSDSEDDYEKCDHEYTIFSNGSKTCLTCGLEVMEIRNVPKEGYQNRVIVQRKTGSLHIVIRSTFKDLIFRLSHSQITVENSLEKLLETCEKYLLPDDTVEEGKRKHPFQVSARPKGLCAEFLW